MLSCISLFGDNLENFSRKELKFLERQQVGRLATISRYQVPHVTPLCYASDEERIYLSTGYDSKKARNIKESPKVAFAVDEFNSWEDYRGVMVSGKAEFVVRGKFHQIGRDLIYKKYPKWEEEYPIQEGSNHVLVITPVKVVSWNL
jgi:nitroimidazol reductase NimA-like FMN-containing flavoprotein (pyridoxamine 5'-phosphate oxidase superfamily)